MARFVVLDVDGTLMDTNYLHTEAWARAFEEVGHRIPRARLHKQIGKGSSLLIREFVEDEETEERINELHSEIYAELQEYGHPLPGAKELIFSPVSSSSTNSPIRRFEPFPICLWSRALGTRCPTSSNARAHASVCR